MIAALVATVVLTTPRRHPVANRSEWVAVAQCESDGQWHDTTGSYDGGLQFSPTTWTSMDTKHYAVRADLATRRQQMIVANHLLRVQGWRAWPVCSIVAGAR